MQITCFMYPLLLLLLLINIDNLQVDLRPVNHSKSKEKRTKEIDYKFIFLFFFFFYFKIRPNPWENRRLGNPGCLTCACFTSVKFQPTALPFLSTRGRRMSSRPACSIRREGSCLQRGDGFTLYLNKSTVTQSSSELAQTNKTVLTLFF